MKSVAKVDHRGAAAPKNLRHFSFSFIYLWWYFQQHRSSIPEIRYSCIPRLFSYSTRKGVYKDLSVREDFQQKGGRSVVAKFTEVTLTSKNKVIEIHQHFK